MMGATKIDTAEQMKLQFEEKHKDILLEIGNRFGDALCRQDVDEIVRFL